ncbi:hypothetical protein JL722_2672 [Aureococcus anophagefferens]|nr:hypothetical protein JL722_2672 [Aureococcus anophagefferens]
MALTEAGHNRRQPEQRKRAAVAAADADVQQPPAKEGRRGDGPGRRGVTAATLAQLSAVMLAAFYVVVDELGIPREEVSIPRASEVIAAAAVMAMNYDPKSGTKKGDGHTRKTNPCAGFQLKGLFTALYKVHTINAQAATAAAAAVVVIDRIPVVLAVKARQPPAARTSSSSSATARRTPSASSGLRRGTRGAAQRTLFARGSHPAFFSVGKEQPAFAKRIIGKLGASSDLLLGHFLHPDAFLRAFRLKTPADIDQIKSNPDDKAYQSLNLQLELYVGSDLAVDAFMGHLELATSAPSSLYANCFRRLGPAFEVLGAARSARSKALWEGEDSPNRRARTAGSAASRDRSSRFATAPPQALAAGNFDWRDASVDGRTKARAGVRARDGSPLQRPPPRDRSSRSTAPQALEEGRMKWGDGPDDLHRKARQGPAGAVEEGRSGGIRKYATPAEAAAANRATSAAKNARVKSDGRACYLPGGCDGSSGGCEMFGCEIPEGYNCRPALVEMLTHCATCRRRAKVILGAPDPRSPDLIPAAGKSPGPWFFTALSLAKAANVCPVMGQYNESRYKSAATLAREKRRLEGN